MHCEEPVPIDRFRGNLVLNGGDAFAEDEWTGVRIGGQVLRAAGPCQRCQMVCIDQVGVRCVCLGRFLIGLLRAEVFTVNM
jgi:uncharacterized protein YcbX